MRKREYKCVDGIIHVLESPRVSISNNEYDAYGLLCDPDSGQWSKVNFDTATEAGEWVDENKDPNVYRIPRHFEVSVLKEAFSFLLRMYGDSEPTNFDELSDSDMLKSERNVTNIIKIMKVIHECNIYIDAELAKAVQRISDIKELSK